MVLKSWWKHYSSNTVKVIIHKQPEKWERLKWTTVSLKDSLATKNKWLCIVLPDGCLLCIFVSSQKYIPTTSVRRHVTGRTILNDAMKSLCGKRRDHPKFVTARTNLLDDECFIILLKQLTMNAVRLNSTNIQKPSCCGDEWTRIYFTNEHQQNPGDNIWYKKSPLGKNEVVKLLLKAAQNNSVRTTYISKLLDSDIHMIVQFS